MILVFTTASIKADDVLIDVMEDEDWRPGTNKVCFAVMYHSVIIQAALRIMKGAKNTKDICEVSPDYEATGSCTVYALSLF